MIISKNITINRIKFDNAFRQKRNTSSKYTTKSIAHKLGIAPTTIYHLMDKTAEKNNKKLDLNTAVKLATGFDMSEKQAIKWVHSIDPSAFSLKMFAKRYHNNGKGLTTNQKIVANIKRVMTSKQITLTDLYNKTQVNKSTLENILYGVRPKIDKLTIGRIAQGLGIKPSALLPTKKKSVHANKKNTKKVSQPVNASVSSSVEINAKRSSVRRLANDASKLSDIDVNLIDMLVQRMSEYKAR